MRRIRVQLPFVLDILVSNLGRSDHSYFRHVKAKPDLNATRWIGLFRPIACLLPGQLEFRLINSFRIICMQRDCNSTRK